MSRLRKGATNPLVAMGLTSIVVVGALVFFMWRPKGDDGHGKRLFLYCAAGMRKPIDKIAKEYEQEFGVKVDIQYAGSNHLLNQIQVAKTGDLYLAGDDSYVKMAIDQKLAEEEIPVAFMRPVIAVAEGNPKSIKSLADLQREDVRVALGNPDQAAIGKKTRKLTKKAGQWEGLNKSVTKRGVFKATVPDVATDVQIGAADAGIIWDATAEQHGLTIVRTPELDKGEAQITFGVLTSSKDPAEALRFARFAAARDRGLKTFDELGYRVVDGDVWGGRVPEVTFFAGAVNRRALEPIIKRFQDREGVKITTVYNGCGHLTSQMRTMVEKKQANGFPDMYMACDVYYLDTVQDLFQEGVKVSNAELVIAVAKGNPKGIKNVKDLARSDVRVAIGQPEQCTIGVLTRRLLQAEGIYDQVMKKKPPELMTSALLIPSITTGSSDAVIAYNTDTLAEADRLDVIAIESQLAVAVQPYSISRSSEHKYLGERLFRTISRSKDKFEKAGFQWRLPGPVMNYPSPKAGTPQTGASPKGVKR